MQATKRIFRNTFCVAQVGNPAYADGVNQLQFDSSHRPYAGQLPELRDKYDRLTKIGRSIRRKDAELRLTEMESAEEAVQRLEFSAEQIRHRISRMNAQHRISMDYLMRFGVPATCRDHFRDILAKVRVHGALTLKEAAAVARASWEIHKENGDPSSESMPVEGRS